MKVFFFAAKFFQSTILFFQKSTERSLKESPHIWNRHIAAIFVDKSYIIFVVYIKVRMRLGRITYTGNEAERRSPHNVYIRG